jgi:MFS family permease
MHKLFAILGGLFVLWVSWGLYRFLSPAWAVTSTHDKLYGILFYLAYWTPVAAIIFAGLLYDRNRSRGRVVAYVVISLICAVVGYALGAALGIAWTCSSQSAGNLCAIIGIVAVGPFASALAIVLVAGLWRKA